MFATPRMTRSAALTTTEALSALTHLVGSLEVMSNKGDQRNNTLMDWELVRDEYAWAPRPVRRVLDFLGKPRVNTAVHGLRIAVAASLLVPGTSRHHRAAAGGFLALSAVATNPQQHFATDGSDQVAFAVQSVAAVARLGEDQPKVVDACLWFIALQSGLAYCASGLTKLAGPPWRSGEALAMVMRTESYGDEWAYRMTQRHPRLATWVSHLVIALECGFPVVFLARGRLTVPVLTATGTFHLANAQLMGLSRFVWAFLSTYPSLLYVTQRPGAVPGGRTR